MTSYFIRQQQQGGKSIKDFFNGQRSKCVPSIREDVADNAMVVAKRREQGHEMIRVIGSEPEPGKRFGCLELRRAKQPISNSGQFFRSPVSLLTSNGYGIKTRNDVGPISGAALSVIEGSSGYLTSVVITLKNTFDISL
jgi:hypothetical protein